MAHVSTLSTNTVGMILKLTVNPFNARAMWQPSLPQRTRLTLLPDRGRMGHSQQAIKMNAVGFWFVGFSPLLIFCKLYTSNFCKTVTKLRNHAAEMFRLTQTINYKQHASAADSSRGVVWDTTKICRVSLILFHLPKKQFQEASKSSACSNFSRVSHRHLDVQQCFLNTSFRGALSTLLTSYAILKT